MTPRNDFAPASAATILLVANTPWYLFKKLREHPSVIHIGREVPTSAILEKLRRWAALRPRSIRDMLRVYVSLVALSFKQPKEFEQELSEIVAPNIEWFDQLKESVISAAEPRIQTEFYAIPSSPRVSATRRSS